MLLLLSGSGKTAAFLVPIVNTVLNERSATPLIAHHCDIVNLPYSHVYNDVTSNSTGSHPCSNQEIIYDKSSKVIWIVKD